MITVVPRKEQFLLAKEKAEEIGSLNNSIRGGDGNLIGCMAEIICSDELGWTLANTYDYDCISGDFKIDVKTKERSVPPRGHYYASVADYNTTQKCSHYAFCSTIGKSTVFILGIIDKEEFYDTATFFKKGDYDPSSSPTDAFYFTADCYNLEYSKLRGIGAEPILL
jgi:hypothetical protein